MLWLKKKISILIFKVKRNFISHAYAISSSIIDNDICVLKKNIDCLGSNLSQCVIDHKRLESMFQKKQTLHMHTHPLRHIHAHHVHTHATQCLVCSPTFLKCRLTFRFQTTTATTSLSIV